MTAPARPTQFGRIHAPDEAWLATRPPEPVLDPQYAAWKAGVTELARCPNVVMKLGGMMMRLAAYDYRTAPSPPTSDELAALWSPVHRALHRAVRT